MWGLGEGEWRSEGRRRVVEIQDVAVTVAAVVAFLLTIRNGRKGRNGTGVWMRTW